MVKWTRDMITGLSTDGLRNLRANALGMGAVEVLLLCDEELAIRNVKAIKAGRTARPDAERNAESEAAAKLEVYAKRLVASYDLSTETAKLLSKGVKKFRALDLLGKRGAAKVGQLQKEKDGLALERYISYRLREDHVCLAYILLKDRRVEDARWVVVGPSRLIPSAMKIVDQIEGISAIPKAFAGDFGFVFESFEPAAHAFSDIIEQFAPPRGVD